MDVGTRAIGLLVLMAMLCGTAHQSDPASARMDAAVAAAMAGRVQVCRSSLVLHATGSGTINQPLTKEFKYYTRIVAAATEKYRLRNGNLTAVVYKLTIPSVVFDFDVLLSWANSRSWLRLLEVESLLYHHLIDLNWMLRNSMLYVHCYGCTNATFSLLPTSPPMTVAHYNVHYLAYVNDTYNSTFANRNSAAYKLEKDRLSKRLSYGFSRAAKGLILSLNIESLLNRTGLLGINFHASFTGSTIASSLVTKYGMNALLRANFLVNIFRVLDAAPRTTSPPPSTTSRSTSTTTSTQTTPKRTTSTTTSTRTTPKRTTSTTTSTQTTPKRTTSTRTSTSTTATTTSSPPPLPPMPVDDIVHASPDVYYCQLTIEGLFIAALADLTSNVYKEKAATISNILLGVQFPGATTRPCVYSMSSGSIVIDFAILVVWKGHPVMIPDSEMKRKIMTVGPALGLLRLTVQGRKKVDSGLLPTSAPNGVSYLTVSYTAFLQESFTRSLLDKDSDAFRNQVLRLRRRMAFGFAQIGTHRAVALKINGFRSGSLGVDFSVAFETASGADFSRDGVQRAAVRALVMGLFSVISCSVGEITKPSTAKSLSNGAIAGIGIGSVVVVAALIVGAILMWRRRSRPMNTANAGQAVTIDSLGRRQQGEQNVYSNDIYDRLAVPVRHQDPDADSVYSRASTRTTYCNVRESEPGPKPPPLPPRDRPDIILPDGGGAGNAASC